MKKNKHFIVLIPLIIFLTGCGVRQADLATDFGGLWQSLVYMTSLFVIWCAQLFGNNLVVGLIIATTITRIIMIKPYKMQIKSQEGMSVVQPKIKKLQSKYPDRKDRDSQIKMQQEMQALYKENGVNPFSGCLPALIQMPFLFVFYGAIQNLFYFTDTGVNPGETGVHAGEIITNSQLSTMILNVDFGEPLIFMALLSAIGTWASTYVGLLGMEKDNPTYSMMSKMAMFMPIFIFFIGLSLPGAMALYWLIGSIFTVAQTLFFKRDKIKEIKDKAKINKN